MEDLEDSEIQFSEWTDSLDDELMETEDITTQDNVQQSESERNASIRDSSKVQRVTSSCVPVDCDGKTYHVKENCLLSGYLSSGVIDRITHPRQDVGFGECTLQLFGSFKFAACDALLAEPETLFYLLRQQIFKIENMQSEEGLLPLSYEMNAKCIEIRKECVQFMSYLHHYINSCLLSPSTTSTTPDNQFTQIIHAMPDILRQQLEALVVFLGRLTDLPITSLVSRTDTLCSAARPSAVFHLVHLYLELVWNVIQALWEILVNRDNGNRGHSVDDIIVSLKTIILSLLWDLTAAAAASYNKVSRTDIHKTSPFLCSCVCEVWVLLIQTQDHLSAEYDVEPFWSSLSSILQQVMAPDEVSDSDETPSQVRSNFIINDPVGFSWWLISQVAPLYWFNERGVYSARKMGSTAGNWVFVVDLLKSSLGEIKDGHDEVHCRFYLACCLAVSQHWSANTGVVVWLWDYYHKRMNELFNIPSHTLHGLTTLNLTATQWVEQCLGRCQDPPASFDQEKSYSIFLKIISMHLSKLLHTRSQQGWKKMKGRFYSKFHKRRMEDLNETGLTHFISLFLTLSCLADLEDVATKMCYFLDLLEFASELPGKRVIIVKGLFALMLVYKHRKVDFAYLANKVSTMFTSIAKEYSETQTRDKSHHRHLWDLVVVYLDSTVEILEHKNKQDLSESKLLAGEGFQWLFSCCRDNELRHVLTFIQSILALARPSRGDRMNTNDSNQDLLGFLWSVMFSHLQKMCRDRTIVTSLSINLADTMAAFTLLALEKYPVPIAEASNVSFVDLVREYGLEDDIPASFSCRYLCHVIAAPGAVSVLQSESLQGHVIHTWFRCLLQLPPTHDNCAAFSRAVAKLPEMESLTKNQAGFGLSDSSENTLKQFIMSVGNYHSTLTKFDEVIQFRERTQQYFGDVAKYVDPFVTSGKPQDSLRLAFTVTGLLFKHCYKTIYSKTQPHCLLPRLLDQLIVPLHSNKKTVPPAVQQCVKASLHWFLQGLSCLDFKRDDFIKRKIRQIFAKYFHPLSQKTQATANQPGSVSVKNPFLVALKDSMEREPSQDASDFRQFAVEVIADTFLQLPQPPQNLTSTLYFISQLFKRTALSSKEIARNTVCMLMPVLGCLLACNASPPASEPPDIRRQATDLLRMMIESCKETQDKNYRDVLLPLMRSFVFNNLQQFQGLVFKTLEPLTVLDPVLVVDIIPVLKQSVMQSEQKRGVGSDSQLRGALRALLQRIGRAHEADIDSTS